MVSGRSHPATGSSRAESGRRQSPTAPSPSVVASGVSDSHRRVGGRHVARRVHLARRRGWWPLRVRHLRGVFFGGQFGYAALTVRRMQVRTHVTFYERLALKPVSADELQASTPGLYRIGYV